MFGQIDESTVLLGCIERLQRGSSAPLLPLTHYPCGSVLAPQSGLLLLLINLQEINQRGGVPVSVAATNVHLFR